MINLVARWRLWGTALALVSGSVLTACSSYSRPKPAELTQVPSVLKVETAWSGTVGEIRLPIVPTFTPDGHVVLANQSGELFTIRMRDGQLSERVRLDQTLNAAAGSDGTRHAVVTRDNDLVVVAKGKTLWQQRLTAQVFTPPLVAGERVFVLMADRSVQAFDGATGRSLWVQSRPGDSLVLRQSGTLMAHRNTLVAGLSGRLTGFDPTTGQIRWEATLASPRGLNDLERLVDVVGLSSRADPYLCARAYQAQIGCVDAVRGQLMWTRLSQGDQGLSGNASLVVGTESNGMVAAWQRSNGDRVWEFDRLKYRRLSAPLVTDKAVWVGDETGAVYLLDPRNGQLLNRIQIDGSPLISPPLQYQGMVLLVTRNGTLRALRTP